MINIIAAIGKNRELGKNNKLPWHIPEDFKRFKKLTTGNIVIMGRKTFNSIGKGLPNRVNIIITRDRTFTISARSRKDGQIIICHSLEEAIKEAKKFKSKEIFIIGGGQIYEQTMKYADRLYLTVINKNFTADTYFPDYSRFKKIIFKENHKDNNYQYSFLVLEKSE